MILFRGCFCYDDPSMFGEKARRIEELEQQVAGLEEERESFAPFIADAQAIHDEVSNLMSHPGTTETIAQKAFEHVLATRRSEVETSLRDFHIQANIDDLLEAAADTVEQTEGERIALEAVEMVESDSKLAAAVQEKARQIAWEEALGRIATTEKKAAEEALLLEEERRIFFNKLNVQYEFDGELNLADEELLRYLKHGDKLRLELFAHRAKIGAMLEMTWRDAAEDTKGWVITHCTTSVYLYENEYQPAHSKILIPYHGILVPSTIIGYRRNADNIIKDDMKIGFSNNSRKSSLYWMSIGAGETDHQPVVTDCRLEAKKIESLEPPK